MFRHLLPSSFRLSTQRARKLEVAELRCTIFRHQSKLLASNFDCGPSGKLWIFDEIHKYRRWRNYLKGLYDGRPRGQRILVTGSGRLDLYRFGEAYVLEEFLLNLLEGPILRGPVKPTAPWP